MSIPVTPKTEKVKVGVEKPEVGLPLSPPTEEYHHIRVHKPDRYDSASFRIIEFNKGIKATIGCPKGQFKHGKCRVGTEVQKLLFPKNQYSLKEAKAWVKKHPKLRVKKKK